MKYEDISCHCLFIHIPPRILYNNVFFHFTPWRFKKCYCFATLNHSGFFWRWSQIKTLSAHLSDLLCWKINLSEFSGRLQQVFPLGFFCILLHSIYQLLSQAIQGLLQRINPLVWCCCRPLHFYSWKFITACVVIFLMPNLNEVFLFFRQNANRYFLVLQLSDLECRLSTISA